MQPEHSPTGSLKAHLIKKPSDGVLRQVACPITSNPSDAVCDEAQSEGKAANKCSAYMGTPLRLLEELQVMTS